MDRPTTVTARDGFRALAADAPPGTRVPVEVRVRVDPFDAYRRARGSAPCFYLETSGGQAGWGYFGVDPAEFVAVGPDGPDDPETGTLDRLTDVLDGESLVRGDCDVPYPGGVFGWLSYDVAREIEDLPDSAVDDRRLPRLQVGCYPTVAAWHVDGVPGADPANAAETLPDEATLRVLSAPRVGSDPDAAYDRGVERAHDLAASCLDGDPAVGSPRVDDAAASFESTCSRTTYADRVREVQEAVRDGDTFQANVSHRLRAPAAVHPVTAFGAVRRVNPAPYSGLVEFPGVDLVSASPELLVEVEGDRLTTEPIAGTRPRGDTPAEDSALERDLLDDPKERAEHAMLVDLERNDLGKVCEYGSVVVDDYRRVDRYAAVMHLVSVVRGTRRPDVDLADVVAATFPGGTITGAPKPKTMEIIDRLEATRRGPYTGSILAAGFDGRATLNILIRTLVRTGDHYDLRVGGGVVHDSVPDREYEETLAKARALVAAMDDAFGDRADLAVAGPPERRRAGEGSG
ncbi:MAG: aminodeoxychorismate synthase, subunit I [uncultured archaeon A07HB70]|nr:MAG: aminodeoxychorismate synthase, subunit I [uncultured archaeon A07HB70]